MRPTDYLPGRLGFADGADVDEFVAVLERYERGELSSEEWRAFRLLRGVYGQRQPEVHMLRVKIPQGVLTAPQLLALAQVTEAYGSGLCHVTTRQNIQLHDLRLAQVEAAMRALADAGLTTREACGHSVRTITACPLAGVDAAEVFDVTPYADALTRHLLRGPRSASLPRKFKIAFEGCHRGCTKAPIHDLAFIARIHEEDHRRGFTVVCGGGLSTLPRSAGVLVPFLPAAELLTFSEAVLRVYHREGERKNKHKARIKWLIERVGFPAFREAVLAEWARVEVLPLPFDPQDPPAVAAPEVPPLPPALTVLPTDAGYGAFLRESCLPQRQPGFVAVLIRLPLGALRVPQLRALAGLLGRYGDTALRTTVDQNLALRFVPQAALPALYERLRAAELLSPGVGSLADVVSCPGAESCALAVTTSRALGRVLADALGADEALRERGADRVHLSGCPNGCGQHHVAAIGLQGALRKVGGRAVPAYQLTIGGAVEGAAARFGRLIGKIPARRVEAAVRRLRGLWLAERGPEEPLGAFLQRVEVARVRALLQDLLDVELGALTDADFIDTGLTAPAPVGEAGEAGAGECAA